MRTTHTRLELERIVLGHILAEGDQFWALPAGFGAQVFRDTTLRVAFEAVQRMASAKALPKGEIDVAHLAASERLPDGIAPLLVAISRSIGSSASTEVFARDLMELHRRESLSRLLAESAQALQGDQATEEVTGKLVAELLDLGHGEKPEVHSFRESVLSTLDVMDRQKKGKGSVLRTGLSDLDKLLHMRPGNVVVLAARPGVGKTTLALNIADSVALDVGHVLVHSLEMNDTELVTLALSRAAEIDSETFFDEEPWAGSKWERIASESERRFCGGDGRLWINDSHHTLGAICRITEKMHRKLGLSLVVLDYIQLVQVDLGKGANREQVVATISRTLKLLAMRLGIPILVLSQLNREVEKRNQATTLPRCAKCQATQNQHQGKNWDGHPFEKPPLSSPKLSDLRESGAIEQDANAVMFLHHPWAESDDPLRKRSGPYELIVAKQRLGKKGKVYLWADLQFARFRPYSRAVESGGHWAERVPGEEG